MKASEEWQPSTQKEISTGHRKEADEDRFPVVLPYISTQFVRQVLVSPRAKQKSDHLL